MLRILTAIRIAASRIFEPMDPPDARKNARRKALAATLQAEIAAAVAERTANGGARPGLAAVLVGDDPASQVYVRNKRKACEQVGMAELAARAAGRHDAGRAARPRRPAQRRPGGPRHPGAAAAAEADRRGRGHPGRRRPLKDVDGFGPENLGLLAAGHPRFLPCTPHGVQQLLRAQRRRHRRASTS